MNQSLQVNSYAEKLALFEINDVPKHWKPRNGRETDYTGRCYEMGIRYVEAHGGIKGMLLVHGAYKILSRGSLYAGHCWVELPEGIMYDGTLCRFYTQEGYAQITGATPFRKYTIKEVARESKKYGYYALGFDEKFPGARHAYLMTRLELERVLEVINESQLNHEAGVCHPISISGDHHTFSRSRTLIVTKVRFILILLALLFTAAPLTCRGGESIDYQEYEINGVTVKAVIADLSDRHVKVRPVVAYGLPFSEQDFTYFLMRAKPVAAINGTYFNMETSTPVGEISIDGRLIHYSRIGTVMAITKDNKISFFPGRNFSTVKRKDFFTTLGGGPRLLKNGVTCAPFRGEGFSDPAIFGSAVRSAAGATRKGKLVLAVALSSVTLSEWASTLRALGVTDAINLDGGTSSGLSYRGIIFVTPGRKLSNILTVTYIP